jgi:hypothetical protein
MSMIHPVATSPPQSLTFSLLPGFQEVSFFSAAQPSWLTNIANAGAAQINMGDLLPANALCIWPHGLLMLIVKPQPVIRSVVTWSMQASCQDEKMSATNQLEKAANSYG